MSDTRTSRIEARSLEPEWRLSSANFRYSFFSFIEALPSHLTLFSAHLIGQTELRILNLVILNVLSKNYKFSG